MKVVGRFKTLLLYGGRWQHFAIGLFAFALVSCTAPTRYMGISLLPGAAAPALQDLAARARAGDKQAQLELGIAFQEGCGIERDLHKARNLYRLSASDSGGPRWIYAPSPIRGQRGRVVQANELPVSRGLSEAARRLELLEMAHPSL